MPQESRRITQGDGRVYRQVSVLLTKETYELLQRIRFLNNSTYAAVISDALIRTYGQTPNETN